MIKKYFKKRTVGIFLLGLTFLFWTIAIYFFNGESTESNILLFTKNITCIVGLLLVVPSDWFATHVYDNREYEKNETIDELVEKIRYRAVLFNNISVLVFIFTIAVIVAGFWILGRPDTKEQNVDIAVRISASVLLIFLVQILFRLFKYLLRVAAFYNGKADAIEFSNLQKNLPIDKTIDYFTPDRYDISDLESPNFVEVLKAKLGIK